MGRVFFFGWFAIWIDSYQEHHEKPRQKNESISVWLFVFLLLLLDCIVVAVPPWSFFWSHSPPTEISWRKLFSYFLFGWLWCESKGLKQKLPPATFTFRGILFFRWGFGRGRGKVLWMFQLTHSLHKRVGQWHQDHSSRSLDLGKPCSFTCSDRRWKQLEGVQATTWKLAWTQNPVVVVIIIIIIIIIIITITILLIIFLLFRRHFLMATIRLRCFEDMFGEELRPHFSHNFFISSFSKTCPP